MTLERLTEITNKIDKFLDYVLYTICVADLILIIYFLVTGLYKLCL